MAVISIFAKNAQKDNITEVVALNEEHFIFDPVISFLQLEFLLYLHQSSNKINILLHGNIVKNGDPKDYYKKIKNNVLYDKWIIKNVLDKIFHGKPVGHIYNLGDTFLEPEKYRTNWCYEPPQEKIEVIDKTERKFKIYLQEAITPKYSADVDNKHCTSTIEIISDANTNFPANTVLGFRLGLWLGSPQYKYIATFYDRLRLQFIYDIHYFILPEDDANCMNDLESLDTGDAYKYSRLWSKINPKDGIQNLIKLFNNKKCFISKSDEYYSLSNELTTPHSDLWVVLPDDWDIKEKYISRSITKPLEYISFMPNELITKEIPFSQYHIKLNQLINTSYLSIEPTIYVKPRERTLKISIKRMPPLLEPLLIHVGTYLSIISMAVLSLITITKNILILNEIWTILLVLFCSSMILDIVFLHKSFLKRLRLLIINSSIVRQIGLRILFINIELLLNIMYILLGIILFILAKMQWTLIGIVGTLFTLIGIIKCFYDVINKKMLTNKN